MEFGEPFTFCKNVSEYYRNYSIAYDNFAKTWDESKSKNCGEYFFNTNQLHWFQTIKEQADNLWESAFCSDCYESTADIRKPFIPSNSTTDFYNFYYKKFVQCIEDWDNNKELQKNVTLCSYCEKNYTMFNDFFDAISKHAEKKVCFDMTDLVRTKNLILNFC